MAERAVRVLLGFDYALLAPRLPSEDGSAPLAPRVLVGIGAYAEARLRAVAGDHADIRRLLHPSPASPLANKGWDAAADAFAADVGLRG